MDTKFAAIVYRAEDAKEFDKRVHLLTPLGAKTAVLKGVKRPNARLRFAAMPFAFCEFCVVTKNGFNTITAAAQIEDLFSITADPDRLTAGSLILEAGYCALKTECPAQFVFLLHRLKEALYSAPFLAAVRLLQYLIHDAGYGYNYAPVDGEPQTPLELLSVLNSLAPESAASHQDAGLVKKTLNKIAENFEAKFEVTLQSKKFI